MRIALIYNRDSKNVINLFGIPNREQIGIRTIRRIADALKSGKHQVKTIEGDKDLIDRLEEFMPKVVKGERPGLVFNVSYGIQGQARYTHVPSILEMVGVPYVGSGPLAHGLALDKVMAKMIFRQHGLPTPHFTVLHPWDSDIPRGLSYPVVVKPKNEAVSFGVRIVSNSDELQEAAAAVFEVFKQPVLVEHFIEGREINVGLLGNIRPEAFPPVELIFGTDGPPIYTYEDKVHTSGRQIKFECPARIENDLTLKAQDLARRAFEALGCYDCARVDMRLDENGRLYILEVNSLPSLGEHGSYLIGAKEANLDFPELVNRLVDVTSARYFGTPRPMRLTGKDADPEQLVFAFLTERRDQIERRLRFWTNTHSRSNDHVGIQDVVKRLNESFEEIGLSQVERFSDGRLTWAWETQAGIRDGTLFIGHIDVPLGQEAPVQEFRRDPEWLHGEGIGLSRAPLTTLEFALKALKSLRKLRRIPLGVLYYADEGRDAIQSEEIIRAAATEASRVLILRPGNVENKLITQRRGQRKYRLRVEGIPARLGKARKKPDVMHWTYGKLAELSSLSSQKDRIAVAAIDVKAVSFPMLLPHILTVTLLATYGDEQLADELESRMRQVLGTNGNSWELEMISDRPPMKKSPANRKLVKELEEIANRWEIPFEQESSLWPSVAGLVPASVGVVCGVGPVAINLCTPQEAAQRISLLQRTLLIAEFLIQQSQG